MLVQLENKNFYELSPQWGGLRLNLSCPRPFAIPTIDATCPVYATDNALTSKWSVGPDMPILGGDVDKTKIDAFWAARTSIKDRRVATNYRDDGRLFYDADFVRRYLPADAKILDLGAGTCTLSVELLNRARKIVAVEKQSAFLNNAPEHPRLVKACSDIVLFDSEEIFDVVLMFGIVNFLTLEEEVAVYKSCLRYVGDRGVLLVKHQCGVNESLVVDSYSDELNSHYHARYPGVAEQVELLSTFFNVEISDIYPAKLNRWSNTHFFAFICRQRGIRLGADSCKTA